MNPNLIKTIKITFGIMVAIFAFNAFTSVYTFLFDNIYSPFADDLTNMNDPIVDAFAAQMTGYRITIFAISVIALFSNKISYIYILSIGILILNSYQLIYMLFHHLYSFETITAVLFILLSSYCLFKTKGAA